MCTPRSWNSFSPVQNAFPRVVFLPRPGYSENCHRNCWFDAGGKGLCLPCHKDGRTVFSDWDSHLPLHIQKGCLWKVRMRPLPTEKHAKRWRETELLQPQWCPLIYSGLKLVPSSPCLVQKPIQQGWNNVLSFHSMSFYCNVDEML